MFWFIFLISLLLVVGEIIVRLVMRYQDDGKVSLAVGCFHLAVGALMNRISSFWVEYGYEVDLHDYGKLTEDGTMIYILLIFLSISNFHSLLYDTAII